jgi:hypothetical protein
MFRGGVMTTDNGHGMRYVGFIILASVLFFIVAVFVAWIGDDLMGPAFNSSSVPAATKF